MGATAPPLGVGSLMDRFAPIFFELNEIRIWTHLGPILSILSPLATGFYIWLYFRRSPLSRLAGITALLTSAIHFCIYHLGGAIELRDRYYQLPAFLFLAVTATYLFQNSWRRYMAKFILVINPNRIRKRGSKRLGNENLDIIQPQNGYIDFPSTRGNARNLFISHQLRGLYSSTTYAYSGG